MENGKKDEQKVAKNYLLLVASLISRKDTAPVYYAGVEVEEVFTGVQTNVAVTKYISTLLQQSGSHLDKIIMLCSKEVSEQKLPDFGGRTSREVYQDEIVDFFSTHNIAFSQDMVEAIPLDIDNSDVDGVSELVPRVLEATDGQVNDHTLYIDYTGGLRTASMALVFVARIMQNQGVKVGGVFYANLSGGRGTSKDNPANIEACSKIYSTFDLLAGIMEINSSGGGKSIQGYADKYGSAELKKVVIKANEAINAGKAGIKKEATSISTGKINSPIEKMVADTIKMEAEKDIWTEILDKCDRHDPSVFRRLRNGPIELLSESGKLIYTGDRGLVDAANELYAINRYYRGSYLPFVRNLLEEIMKNKDVLPSITFKHYAEYAYKLSSYTHARLGNVNLNDFLRERFERFYPQGKEEVNHSIGDLFSDLQQKGNLVIEDLIKVVTAYNQRKILLESLYYGFGFPFMCTWTVSARTFVFPYYESQYKESIELEISKLDGEFRRGKLVQTIETMLNDEMQMEERFDIRYNTRIFKSDVYVREDGKIDFRGVSNFLRQVLPLLDTIRLNRNAIEHNDSRLTVQDIESFYTKVRTLVDILRPE